MSFLLAGPGMRDFKTGKMVGKAIPYQLADSGHYDVWMLNSRGNYLSRDHIWLDPDTEESFWDFSFEEISSFDLPAAIDFIQQTKGSNKKI